MKIDDFGPNLSFFFSAGMEPEYTVMGAGGPTDLVHRHEVQIRCE